MDKLGNGSLHNFGVGFKECPIIQEFKNVEEGIALGDFKKTAINSGLLALCIVPVGVTPNGGKSLISSVKGDILPRMGAVGIMGQGTKNNDKNTLKPLFY